MGGGPRVPLDQLSLRPEKQKKHMGGEGLGTRLGQNHTLYVMGHVIKSSRLSPRSFEGRSLGMRLHGLIQVQ